MVAYALLGWDNVQTLDGVAVPFEARLVGTLPPPVILAAHGQDSGEHAAPENIRKNSPAPSSAGSPSTA